MKLEEAIRYAKGVAPRTDGGGDPRPGAVVGIRPLAWQLDRDYCIVAIRIVDNRFVLAANGTLRLGSRTVPVELTVTEVMAEWEVVTEKNLNDAYAVWRQELVRSRDTGQST